MAMHFTLNDLVAFIYHELPQKQDATVRNELLEDAQLFEAYEKLMIGFTALPEISYEPTQLTIDSILNYSEKDTVEVQY